MKKTAAAFALVLSGCGTVPWVQKPEVSESTCTAACDAHFHQCPQIFAGFPERGAVECPAEHNDCLQSCATRPAAARTAVTRSAVPPAQMPPPPGSSSSSPQAMPDTGRAVWSKEARLRELKHLHEEGLVTDDVYKDRQKTILSEP
jgi:hypothetical protein